MDITVNNSKILEFRKININDINDKSFLKYKINDEVHDDIWAWSRVYEYPLVISKIKEYFGENYDIEIHNTSWGFQTIHKTFKDKLESVYNNLIHSDIIESSLPNTQIYDITKRPDNSLINRFDVVVNVSTVEEVNFNHLEVIENLFSQVKKDGLLIITFDLPGFQVEEFESYFNIKLLTSNDDISGENSVIINTSCNHLNCGLLILKKI
jgi:SAM-dependent methyltransferase